MLGVAGTSNSCSSCSQNEQSRVQRMKGKCADKRCSECPRQRVQTANGQTVPPELPSVATDPSSRSDFEKARGNRKIDQWLIEFRDQKIN